MNNSDFEAVIFTAIGSLLCVLIILAAHGLKQFLEHRRKKEEENIKNDFLDLLRALTIAEVMRIGLSEDQQNGEEE